MALMDSKDNERLKKVAEVKKIAGYLKSAYYKAPLPNKKVELPIQGSTAHITIRHDGLGAESGAFQIFFVDAARKQTALAMKTYQGRINAQSAFDEAQIKAGIFLERLIK